MCYKINRKRIQSGCGQKSMVLETCPFLNLNLLNLNKCSHSRIHTFKRHTLHSKRIANPVGGCKHLNDIHRERGGGGSATHNDGRETGFRVIL